MRRRFPWICCSFATSGRWRGGHISRAASSLRVAQPSLSRTIARLEAELGVPLFDRHGRRIRLNPFGAAFLARVDRIFGELDDARAELADLAGLTQGTIAVAAENLRALQELVLAGFLSDHPGVNFRLYQSSAPVMRRQLDAGEVDLCVASQPIEGQALRTVEILSAEVFLVVPPRHPLADRARAGLPEIADEPFVTTRPGRWQRTLLDRLFSAAGLRPVLACEGDDPAAVRGLVSAGLGLGLLPAVARRATPDPPVGWLRLDAPGCRRTLRIVWRADGYLSAAARRFRDQAVHHLRSATGDG